MTRRLGHPSLKVRNDAARWVWDYFAPRLLALVRRNLDERIRQREDEDDVLQEMYQSFCRHQQDGRYTLNDRYEIWAMLLRLTINKVRKTAARHRAGRRNVGREQAGQALGVDASLCSQWLVDHLAGCEPTPAEMAEFNDEIASFLRMLPEDLRQIVFWKMEGYCNREIAGMIRRTERTVEMKLHRIRQRWEQADSRAD
jgi:DNA-directed RNA polymerase specialized sigma24 family protein